MWRSVSIPLLLLAIACGGGRPDGRVREIRQAAPEPAGGRYVVAAPVAALALPASPSNLTLHGTALYVFMNRGGMAVFDVGDPASPTLTARFDASSFDLTAPGVPAARPHYFFSGTIDGDRLLVADRSRNLILVFDIAHPFAPRLTGAVALPGAPMQVVPYRNDWFVPLGGAGLARLTRPADFATTTTEKTIRVLAPDARPVLRQWDFVKAVAPYDDRWLLVADGYDGGLRMLDTTDSGRPRPVAGFQTGNSCDGVLPFGGFAAVNNRARGVLLVDLTDPARPFLLSHHCRWLGEALSCLDRWGGHGLLAGQRSGFVDVIDVQHPAEPVWLARLPTGRPVNCLTVGGPDGDLFFAGLEWPAYQYRRAQPENLQVWRLIRRGDGWN
jgi:hypothetical protein